MFQNRKRVVILVIVLIVVCLVTTLFIYIQRQKQDTPRQQPKVEDNGKKPVTNVTGPKSNVSTSTLTKMTRINNPNNNNDNNNNNNNNNSNNSDHAVVSSLQYVAVPNMIPENIFNVGLETNSRTIEDCKSRCDKSNVCIGYTYGYSNCKTFNMRENVENQQVYMMNKANEISKWNNTGIDDQKYDRSISQIISAQNILNRLSQTPIIAEPKVADVNECKITCSSSGDCCLGVIWKQDTKVCKLLYSYRNPNNTVVYIKRN